MFQNENKKSASYGYPFPSTDLSQIKNPLDMSSSTSIITISGNTINPSGSSSQTGNFSYSFWIYINGTNGNGSNISSTNNWTNYRYSEWKSIVYRGTEISSDSSLSTMTQFPGFWLAPKMNNLVIVFQQPSHAAEKIEMDNIPFNQWVNIITVVQTNSVNIFVNGYLDRIVNLNQTPLDMAANAIYIAGDKALSLEGDKFGFPGYFMNLVYYDYALQPDYVKLAYEYYSKIVRGYEKTVIASNMGKYSTPGLITNSDVLV